MVRFFRLRLRRMGNTRMPVEKSFIWHPTRAVKLFQNQSQLENADLKRYAKEAGLASSAFNACLDGGVHYKEVMQDYQDGVRAGVRGTPTFFVNGQKVEGVITLPEWEKLITYFKK